MLKYFQNINKLLEGELHFLITGVTSQSYNRSLILFTFEIKSF